MEVIQTTFESKVLKHLSSISYCLESTYSSPEADINTAFNYLDDIILLMLEDRKELIKRISDLEDKSALIWI
jgi:hypothetical protein